MEPDPFFDPTVMARLFGGNREMMASFTERFLESARDALADIDAALAKRDMPRLRHLGHRTLSAALTVGAMAMAEVCRQLERVPDDASGASALVLRLHAAFDATATRLSDAARA